MVKYLIHLLKYGTVIFEVVELYLSVAILGDVNLMTGVTGYFADSWFTFIT